MKRLFFILLLFAPNIVLGASTTFSGTTDIDDAQLHSGAPTGNYGGKVNADINNTFGRLVLRPNNVESTIGTGKTMDSGLVYMKFDNVNTAGNVSLFRAFKTGWVEGINTGSAEAGAICWQSFIYKSAAPQDENWATAGCECADDAGSDNAVDNGTCGSSNADRKATAEDTQYVTTDTSIVVAFKISAATAQALYDGSDAGLYFKGAGGIVRAHTSENTFPDNTYPHVTLFYDGGAAGYNSAQVMKVLIID